MKTQNKTSLRGIMILIILLTSCMPKAIDNPPILTEKQIAEARLLGQKMQDHPEEIMAGLNQEGVVIFTPYYALAMELATDADPDRIQTLINRNAIEIVALVYGDNTTFQQGLTATLRLKNGTTITSLSIDEGTVHEQTPQGDKAIFAVPSFLFPYQPVKGQQAEFIVANRKTQVIQIPEDPQFSQE